VDHRKKKEAHPALPYTGIDRVTTLKILGVTFTNSLSVAEHVHVVISSSAQTLFALRVLRQVARPRHMDDVSLQTIFRSVVVAKLMHASSACSGGLCWCIRPPASCSVQSFAEVTSRFQWLICKKISVETPRGEVHWGRVLRRGLSPSPEKFRNFHPKMVSFGAI